MSLLDIFKKKEIRTAVDPSWSALSASSAGHGSVTPAMAEGHAVVMACVQAISSAVASLPTRVYQERHEGGRDELFHHPLSRLIRSGPNRNQTWPELLEWAVAHVLLRGNALIEIKADLTGHVVELVPHAWENVSLQLLRNGGLAYDVSDISTLYGGAGRQRRLLQHEIIHLRDRSDDGTIAKSRLQRAGGTIQAALDGNDASAGLYRNGLSPSGAFTHPGNLGAEQRAQLREALAPLHGGPSNRGRYLILDQGLDWKGMSMTPEDSELLASRRFAAEDIARIFQVPPPIVGIWDHSSFTNSETAGRWFAQFTIAPWCRKIEAAFNRALLDDEHHMELDLSGFQRGDFEGRWKTYIAAVKQGILTADEVREVEGWNPLEEKE